jgi:hypothetical protein
LQPCRPLPTTYKGWSLAGMRDPPPTTIKCINVGRLNCRTISFWGFIFMGKK